ncbi:ribose-phosphate pyrophosphokinase [Halobacillus rhizosphaerae]|uniref:ribose-phosphate pyrophosphokinase n=1 Tax=Halobacillus rhizosphaerae TaxID=3064889 RepID=UPI00398B47B5
MIKVNGKEVEFASFPNGETRLVESSIHSDEEINVVDFKYGNDSDLIKLMFVKKYLDQNFNLPTTLAIFYMPYSRMDRSEDGSAFTLKYVADFINHLYFDLVQVFEPHSDVTPALLNNSAPIFINFDLLPVVMEDVGFNEDRDVLFFPDAGASKRYSKMNHPHLVGHKHRDFKTGKIESLEVVGKVPNDPFNVIIVDDLSSYGGTFMFSAKKLKELGADKIYLLVAHAEDSIFDGDIFKTDFIDGVFTTNTIMTKNGIWLNKQYDEKLTVFTIND